MQPPAGAQTYEGDFATYGFDSEGILHSRSKSATRTLENTRRTFEMIRKPDKATRELPTVYKAGAIEWVRRYQ